MRSPVECLGLLFESEEERRSYFHGRLRAKLQETAFRAVEGFPVGTDEDILALSDPPYFTVCPNPFIEEFLRCYGKPYDPETDGYQREPFAADVSEGKSDPIYCAHSYHTKVPHRAIMRYLLHFTEPGDVVLDGFCGSGMTGVAAQLCGDAHQVRSLGYLLSGEQISSPCGRPIASLGLRRCILAELSPAAALIARGYNTCFVAHGFAEAAQELLDLIEERCAWMFRATHLDGEEHGTLDYLTWSDLFLCDDCGAEIALWDAVIDDRTRQRQRCSAVTCPECGQESDPRTMRRSLEHFRDPATGESAQRVRQKPIFLRYRHAGKSYERPAGVRDMEIVRKCDEAALASPLWFPALRMPEGLRQEKDAYHLRGITHTHHFYSSRSLIAYATLWHECCRYPGTLGTQLRFWAESVALGFTRLNRFFASSYSQVNRYLKGTLYVAPFLAEVRPGYALRGKIRTLGRLDYARPDATIVSTGSSSALPIPDQSIDYIFIDPPFGRNLQYSELNFLWESWLKVRTNPLPEAIIDESVAKGRGQYGVLIRRCFEELYRVLKPGRWMTVAFQSAESAVWETLQEALLGAGFVVADVRVLDKQQVTMQQWVATNAVRQDLIVSAYRPRPGDQCGPGVRPLRDGSVEDAWEFLCAHLRQLPVVAASDGHATVVAERQRHRLFDRMVAFHVRQNLTVPLSAAEFYTGLAQRFPERKGMYFLPEQAAEYDRGTEGVTG